MSSKLAGSKSGKGSRNNSATASATASRRGGAGSGNGGGGGGGKSSPHLQSARQVFDSLRRIVRVLRLSARHTEKAFGLSAAQLFVVQKLAESPTPLTPSELAEKALTDQSS